MKLHANAELSLNKRRLLTRRVVDQGWTLSEAAAAAEVSVPTARKWSERYRREGELGLLDRSSAPRRVHNRTPEDRIEAIAALRRLRFIRTLLSEWAYGAIYRNSAERTSALDGFPWRYNHERKHRALGRKPPAARLAELRNNVVGSYT
jgi:hypothetical protein